MKKSKKEQKRFWTKFWMQFWGYFHICRCIILFVAAVGSFIWLFIDSKQDLGTTSAIILGVIPFGILLWRSIVALIKGKDSFDDCRRERESEVREDELNKQLAEYYRNKKKMGLTNSRRTISKPIQQSDPSEDEPEYLFPKHEEEIKNVNKPTVPTPPTTKTPPTQPISSTKIGAPKNVPQYNKNEIIRKLREGTPVKIDCSIITSRLDLGDILNAANRMTTKIKLINVDLKKMSIHTLIGYSRMAQGKVVIDNDDRPYNADMFAEKLAATGATFYCKKGPQMPYIAKAANGKGGCVTFVGRGHQRVEETKAIGGNNVRILED